MKETGIIMSGDHPVKCIDGAKTKTRRTWGLNKYNKNPNLWRIRLGVNCWFADSVELNKYNLPSQQIYLKCPYGGVGDKLWVKETWAIGAFLYERYAEILYKAENYKSKGDRYFKHTDWNSYLNKRLGTGGVALAGWDKWHPSIFMPKWASRITLEITEIRVERIQEITAEDAIAEGIPPFAPDGEIKSSTIPRKHFAVLWDSLNAKRGYGWETNCWVWCLTFKREG